MRQVNWNRLGGDINPFNPALHQWLVSKGLALSDPAAIGLLAVELRREASMPGLSMPIGSLCGALSYQGLLTRVWSS